ncbi:MAG: fadE [Francisellaceae bacterium]|nr:fadE [Francisellaceae bacterium]
MITLENEMLFLLSFFLIIGIVAYHQLSYSKSAISLWLALILGYFFHLTSVFTLSIVFLSLGILTVLGLSSQLRMRLFTKPLFNQLKKMIPKISQTEKIALEAGTVWWDGEIFSGKPNWKRLLELPAPSLTKEEQYFIDNQVEILCQMVDDWEIANVKLDLPKEIWAYIKKERFFGIVIAKEYGGLGFSALAHSEILSKLASRSLTLAVTVSVPNSLGPGELLHHYGTTEQKNYYLPRLASGEEIPCFALTSPDAGSDATSMPDNGIICKGEFEGKIITGIRLNWSKRYITLAPIASVLGLAFKLFDPEKLIGNKEQLGITCALIPTHFPGISIGNRHLPPTPFQNGPIEGKDVFIPLDWVIGGVAMCGQGWRMLVECLSAGRAISLPSITCGSSKLATSASGAYAFVRQQFKQPVGYFEGVQEVLARMLGNLYAIDSARRNTAQIIDLGQAPSVLGAILKYHVTETGRKISSDAMDIHAGKAIMMGPRNYLAQPYHGVPIGITVEGANILTRSMVIFGQGALRCHPYLMDEFKALKKEDENAPLEFEKIFFHHLSYSLSNVFRSLFYALTNAYFAQSPSQTKDTYFFKQLNRTSASFALISDSCLLLLGGKLKFKEQLSARLGDLLSYQYLSAMVLKRFNDDNKPKSDEPLLTFVLQHYLNLYWETMDEIIRNLPNKWFARVIRLFIMPLGKPMHKPSDQLTKVLANMLLSQNETRQRILEDILVKPAANQSIKNLEAAFSLCLQAQDLEIKLRNIVKTNGLKSIRWADLIDEAFHLKFLSPQEYSLLQASDKLRQEVIAVDAFSPENLSKESSFLNKFPERIASIIKGRKN